jgi:hypothetical protein
VLFKAGGLLLGLLLCLTACGSSQPQASRHQSVQTESGTPIFYSSQPQDVLIRLFYGGGKVGSLEFTPEVSIYGDGTFILGPGLQLTQGTLSTESLQTLLQTLASADQLLTLSQQVFDDVPNQNVTLLQVTLNGKHYQFVYGPFGNLQENTQEMQEYHQLGQAIATIKNTLTGPETTYTSSQKALLVYQTSREDFTLIQSMSIPTWSINDISLADAATDECGLVAPDPNNPRPNLDNGCLTYTTPLVVYEPDQQDIQQIAHLLQGQSQMMFQENDLYYVVMLRSLLPDELATGEVAMYGSVGSAAPTSVYMPIPLKKGMIPTPTATP